MITNIKEYTRNLICMVVSLILIGCFFEFVVFRVLLQYLYHTPYWDRLYYSWSDIYKVIKIIHGTANSLYVDHDTKGYALKVLMGFTGLFMFGSFIIIIIVYTVITKIMAIAPALKETRFANYSELKKLGLFKAGGVVIAGYKTWYGKVLPIYHHGEEHIYLESTTGTGKTIAAAIPTALSWTGSAIVNDNKGEIYQKTAGYRQKILKQKIIKLTLSTFGADSAYFNPLLEIKRFSLREESDVFKVGLVLANLSEEEYNDTSNPNIYFTRAPLNLINACIIHCLYTMENPTMEIVVKFISDTNIEELISIMLNTDHISEAKKQHLTIEQQRHLENTFNGEPNHPTVRKNIEALDLVKQNPKQLVGIVDSARTMLQLFYDPLIQKITSKSSFKISDLVDGYEACTLYIIFSPADQIRVSVLNRMVYELAADHMIGDGNKPTFRYKLLLLMDEFAQIGKVNKVKTILEIGRSSGIKVFIILQEQAQLIKTYSKNQIITSQSSVKITYTPNVNSVEFVQKYMVGQTEVHTKSVTKSSNTNSTDSASINTGKTEKYLMTQEELLNLPIIQKKTILIKFIDILNKVKKNNFNMDGYKSDIIYMMSKLFEKYKLDKKLAEMYRYYLSNPDQNIFMQEDYNYLNSHSEFVELMNSGFPKELAISPGEVIINVSTLRPFRQYKGTQFCYIFNKEFLARASIKYEPENTKLYSLNFKF